MLIGLSTPKKVSSTVKLCLWGGDCEARCLRSFSHAKSYRVSFRFTPKLSGQVVVNQRKAIFYTRYCRNKLTQRMEKTGICKSVVIATVVAIRDVVKNGFHCINLYGTCTCKLCSRQGCTRPQNARLSHGHITEHTFFVFHFSHLWFEICICCK